MLSAVSGHHGEGEELGGRGEETHPLLPRLERQRGDVYIFKTVCVARMGKLRVIFIFLSFCVSSTD